MTVTEQTAAVEASRFQTEPVVTLATAHGMHDTYFSFLPTMLPVLILFILVGRNFIEGLTAGAVK